jgi:DNA-binding Lrp family transcriptional regulator
MTLQSNVSEHVIRTGEIKPKAAQISGSVQRRPRETSGLQDVSISDALILREILRTRGKISSLELSRKTGLPLTSVQRHRKRLEERMVMIIHSPVYSAFGLREIVVDIKTEGGQSGHTISELQDFPNVVHLSRVQGDTGFTIRIRILISSNLELANWLDRIKSVEGVRDISWTETVEEIQHSADFMQLLNLSKLIECACP